MDFNTAINNGIKTFNGIEKCKRKNTANQIYDLNYV